MEFVRYMISDAAKRIDVEPHVLRYWEDELAVEIPRNEMGHRYYRDEEIGMMKGVKYLKDKGFQLKSIKILLPDIKKVMALEPRRLLELRDRLELAVSQEELRLQREEELRRCGEEESRKYGEEELGQYGEEAREEVNSIPQEAQKQPADMLEQQSDALEKQADTLEKNFNPLEKKAETLENTSMPVGKANKEKDAGQGKERNRRQEKKEELQNYSGGNIESQGADKFQQFRMMMNEIILDAMSESNRRLSDSISESFSRELEYQMKKKELQEEERYKQLDRTLREYQQGQKQAAVAKEYSGTRRKSKFFKKNKVRI